MTLNEITARLTDAGIPNAKQEALWITAHALGVGTAGIFARKEFSRDDLRTINPLIYRRLDGEPLQYILGEADFYGRDFHVGKGVLIPRHDTETLIEGVKSVFEHDDDFRFIDWGTGSGCIGVTLMLEFPRSVGIMYDVSFLALSFTKKNIHRYGLDERAEICAKDENFTGENFAGGFDLIISNPPYIPSGEIKGLMREVKDFEPVSALDGGTDGMTFYREILALSMRGLRHGGYIILETGNFHQVHEIETCRDFEMVRRIYDNGNFPRCLILRRV